MNPSSFTDSPEDLIERAKSVARAGRMKVDEQTTAQVPPVVCGLLTDLARTLEGERSSRSSSFAVLREQNIGFARTEKSLARAKIVNRVLATIVVGLMVVLAVVTVHGGGR